MSASHTTGFDLAVVAGPARAVTDRELADGRVVTQFDVCVDRGTVPVAWHDASPSARAALDDGAVVLVVGAVRRRFFRVGGATQSRTEVVATTVVPVRRRKQVATALDEAITRLATLEP
jgi:single-strand DNA-binding protein